jgi:multisubunit Na+/H+ antiporter MnhC subunit
MSRSLVALLIFLLAAPAVLPADSASFLPARLGSFRKSNPAPAPLPNDAVFREFGFVSSDSAHYRGPRGKGQLTTYLMKDSTGALAAWYWLRPAAAHRCDFADYCAQDGKTSYLFDGGYVHVLEGITPTKVELQAFSEALPKQRSSDTPSVLGFVPVKDVVPNSARYILGPASLSAVAPELAGANPGFGEGAEAHYTAYRVGGGEARLVLFDYPSPEMARLHTISYKQVSGAKVKRSGVLVAIVLPGASEAQADAILAQVQYQAKILWNEPPPSNPVPTLYKLLMNIIILSGILVALAFTAGLIYGGMRLYRRRYGTLDEDEAMTTLRLSGD